MSEDATDPTLQEIITTLQDEHRLGILLTAQMGGTPEEIQLILQVADFDEDKQIILPQKAYIVRCISVQEHRLSLGMFGTLLHVEDHPLLWNHNTIYHQVYFRGTLDSADGLMLELTQLYGQYYGGIRNIADDLNLAMPLERLLTSGHGLLGTVPLPMAERVTALLERYGLTSRLVPIEQEPPEIQYKLLVMDDSFLIAHLYSVDPVQGKKD
ncbi:MAG: hypothetical protein GYB66_13050 [Chloroflexi bacterium]|nr:hypothetical protein [Chloroflexota bacterium]